MKNPFEFGRELGVEEIVDREAEIAEVKATIEQGGKLFLIGPRRYGKTSILRAAQDRLEVEDAVVLRHDAESYPSLDLLVNALMVDAAKQLKGGVREGWGPDPEIFLRPAPRTELQRDRKRVDSKIGSHGE
jgi:uncharacterized protein